MAGEGNQTVGRVMVPLSEYPWVYDDDTLRDAIDVLRRHRLGRAQAHRSLLVFSRTEKIQGEERLVGILTIRDFFNAIQRNRLVSKNWVSLSMGWACFYRKDPLEESLAIKVKSVLRPLVKAYAQVDDPLTRAVELMMTQKVNLVPVFHNNKVAGIIRAVDILDSIADMLVSGDQLPGANRGEGRPDPVPERGSLWSLWSPVPMPLPAGQ